jgi:hypothetical protein
LDIGKKMRPHAGAQANLQFDFGDVAIGGVLDPIQSTRLAAVKKFLATGRR